MLRMFVPVRTEYIIAFYKRIASQLGYDKDLIEDKIVFDCTEIKVSKFRADAIRCAYDSADSYGFSWLCLGPKAVDYLQPDEILISDDFIQYCEK